MLHGMQDLPQPGSDAGAFHGFMQAEHGMDASRPLWQRDESSYNVTPMPPGLGIQDFGHTNEWASFDFDDEGPPMLNVLSDTPKGHDSAGALFGMDFAGDSQFSGKQQQRIETLTAESLRLLEQPCRRESAAQSWLNEGLNAEPAPIGADSAYSGAWGLQEAARDDDWKVIRRSRSVGPCGLVLVDIRDGAGGALFSDMADDGGSFSFGARFSQAASFATSAWQSSFASFSSETAGVAHDMIIVGRQALPESLALSTMQDCPKRADGSFLSLGSRLHEAGTCTPCKFFRSRRGCRDAALCKLCHYPHENESRSAVRRAVRRTGLKKRAFFDQNSLQFQKEVKNTFIHVGHGEQTARRRSLSL